jgi:hypothetical protein
MSPRAAFFCCLALAACGRAVGPEDGLVYARLTGTINGAPATPNDKVHVALAWMHSAPGPNGPTDEGGQVVLTAQDFAVDVAFPATYHIDIIALPPPESLYSGVVSGALLVYADTNGSGALEYTAPSDPDIRDRLVGTPAIADTEYTVMYSEAAEESGYPRGFSILETRVGQDGTVARTFLPIDTPITLQLTNDPRVSCYLVRPLPSNLPPGNVGFSSTAEFCTDNQPPANSTLACPPYIGAPFYEAYTEIPTSPAIQALCGPAFAVCLIAGPPPPELSCP